MEKGYSFGRFQKKSRETEAAMKQRWDQRVAAMEATVGRLQVKRTQSGVGGPRSTLEWRGREGKGAGGGGSSRSDDSSGNASSKEMEEADGEAVDGMHEDRKA